MNTPNIIPWPTHFDPRTPIAIQSLVSQQHKSHPIDLPDDWYAEVDSDWRKAVWQGRITIACYVIAGGCAVYFGAQLLRGWLS